MCSLSFQVYVGRVVHSASKTVGDGRVVVGRKYVYTNNYYAHVEMDELIFFNQALSVEEVMELHNTYQ